MAIDPREARRIAGLALLELDDAEAERLARQLESVLDHMALLDELELGDDEEAGGELPRADALRDDEEGETLDPEQALGDAPDPASGFFRVPRSLPE